MLESNTVSLYNNKLLFIMRGYPISLFIIQTPIFIFLTLCSLLFVIGKYPYTANDSIAGFLFCLFIFLGMCYLDISLVLKTLSKIEVWGDGLIITSFLLRKRKIPYSRIKSINPKFVFHNKYGQTFLISCNFQFILTDGEKIKFWASGHEKFHQLARVFLEEFENFNKMQRL